MNIEHSQPNLPFMPNIPSNLGLIDTSIIGPSIMTPEEIDFLSSDMKKGLCLEVGSWVCGTTCLLADRRPDIQFHAIDNWPNSDGIVQMFIASINARLRPNVWIHRIPFERFAPIASPVFENIIIDANHSRESVHYDLNAASKILTEDGSIYVHDYGEECISVKEAVDDFLQNNREWKVVNNVALFVKLKKILQRVV